MEIHEISSFEYGDHGELVPIQNRQMLVQALYHQGLNLHYQDTYRWKKWGSNNRTCAALMVIENGWGESDPGFLQLPYASGYWGKSSLAPNRCCWEADYARSCLLIMHWKQIGGSNWEVQEVNQMDAPGHSETVSKQRREPIKKLLLEPEIPTSRQQRKSSQLPQEMRLQGIVVMHLQGIVKPHRPRNSDIYAGNNKQTPRGRRQKIDRQILATGGSTTRPARCINRKLAKATSSSSSSNGFRNLLVFHSNSSTMDMALHMVPGLRTWSRNHLVARIFSNQ